MDTIVSDTPQDTNPFAVYVLIDPQTHAIRYVGATCNIPHRRSQHFSGRDKSNQEKQTWIDDLRSHDLRPILLVLEDNLDKSTALMKEKYWIQEFLEENEPLTNMRDAELLPWECRV